MRQIQFAGYGQSWETPIGWRDITSDGLLELPVWAANGGFCFACNRVYVLQLAPVEDAANPDDASGWQVRELTGAVPFLNLLQNPIIPKWLTDYNGDGKAEIEALDGSFEFAFGLYRETSPRFYRPFVWDGQSFADTSRWSPGYFDGQIQRAADAVQATFGQPLASEDPIGRALTVLLAYDASGRRDEGWAAFLQLSDPGNWTGEAIPGLLDLLGRIREHLQGQFERGEPFAPWPPTVPNLPAPSDAGSPVEASNQITQPLPLPLPEVPGTLPRTASVGHSGLLSSSRRWIVVDSALDFALFCTHALSVVADYLNALRSLPLPVRLGLPYVFAVFVAWGSTNFLLTSHPLVTYT